MSNISKLQENVNELEAMEPRDVSVKMEIAEKRKKIEEILKKESKILNKANIEAWIEEKKPFHNLIWTYTIKNLLGESANSWTAFLLKAHDGQKYKLRICLDHSEIKKTERLVSKHKNSMPNYYGEKKYPECSCFLFKRLDDAHILDDDFDKNVYVDSSWSAEPHEMYKKPAKELARINLWSEIHTNNKNFKKQIEKRMKGAEKIFSPNEFIALRKFFDEHLKSDKLRYGDEHRDAHSGNWMIEKSNPHKAYAIDEGSIAENFLIWFGFASFMNQNLTWPEVRKFLKWYYKIHPTMEFDKSYFELIYALRMLKTISKRVTENKLDMAVNKKSKLTKLIECYHDNPNDDYKDTIPALYNFIHEDKVLHM